MTALSTVRTMSVPAPRLLTSWPYLRVYALPAFMVLAVGLVRLFGGSYKVDTALYAGVGLRMYREGAWWTPMAGDLPYFNKPPLVLWIHGFVLDVLGPSLWAIRLPQLVAAMGCVLLAVAIVRRLSGAKVGLIAGMILALSYPFWVHLHRLVLDYWLVLFTLAGVWMCLVGALRKREAWIIAAGVPVGLAMLCKPLFPVLTLPIMGLWMLAAGHRRMAMWTGVGVGVALLVSLPWHLSMTAIHREVFLDQYFGREIVNRGAGEGAFPTDPWWTYLGIVALWFGPWSVALGGAMGAIAVRLVRTRGGCVVEGAGREGGEAAQVVVSEAAIDHASMRADFFVPEPERSIVEEAKAATPERPALVLSREWQAILLCLIWSVVWLVLLSAFFADKRDRYMMHVWPMLAWLGAMWIVHWAPRRVRAFDSRWIGRGVAGLFALAVVAAAVGLPPQDPVQGKWDDLYAWLERERLEGRAPQVWSGSLTPYEEGQVYLDTGIWPSGVWWAGSAEPRFPQRGAVVIFERDRLENLASALGTPIEPAFESRPDTDPDLGDSRALVAVRWDAAWNDALRRSDRALVGPRP